MPAPSAPGLGELFLAFAGISAVGFGGVLPWARRMLVERKGWLSPDGFAEALSLAQFLPGGNIINLGIVIGQRYRGVAGSIACVAGLLAAPSVIVVALGILYARYGQVDAVHQALSGVTAAAAGLILAMAGKMAQPLFRRDALVQLGFAALAFLAVAVLNLPLPLVLIVFAPLGIAFAWRKLA